MAAEGGPLGSLERRHVDVHLMQQHLWKEDPDVVQSEPAPMPPVIVHETDDGVGKVKVVVEFDENSTVQSRQAQNPHTVY
eukprot:15864-Pyramimonas_sp.AAC.1